jgi:ankyrin repeat protein
MPCTRSVRKSLPCEPTTCIARSIPDSSWYVDMWRFLNLAGIPGEKMRTPVMRTRTARNFASPKPPFKRAPRKINKKRKLTDLPNDVIGNIVNRLNPRNVSNLRKVHKRFRNIVADQSDLYDMWSRNTSNLKNALEKSEKNKIVKALVELNGDVPLSLACDVLMWAARWGSADIIRMLRPSVNVDTVCRLFPDIPQVNMFGTALMRAVYEGHENVVHELLKRNANVNAKEANSMKRSVLHIALEEGNLPLSGIQALLDAGADVNYATPSRRVTPLMTVCHARRQASVTHIIDMLLQRGADINARDRDGDTALAYSVMFDNYLAVRRLLEMGADPFTINADEKMPLEYATDYYIIHLIERYTSRNRRRTRQRHTR